MFMKLLLSKGCVCAGKKKKWGLSVLVLLLPCAATFGLGTWQLYRRNKKVWQYVKCHLQNLLMTGIGLIFVSPLLWKHSSYLITSRKTYTQSTFSVPCLFVCWSQRAPSQNLFDDSLSFYNSILLMNAIWNDAD